MQRRWFVAAVAAAALVGIGIGIAFHKQLNGRCRGRSRSSTPVAPRPGDVAAGQRPAPAFALRDQRGRRVTLASLRGGRSRSRSSTRCARSRVRSKDEMLGAAIRQAGARSDRSWSSSASIPPATHHAPCGAPAQVAPACRHDLAARAPVARLKPVWDAYQITVDPVSGDIVHRPRCTSSTDGATSGPDS